MWTKRIHASDTHLGKINQLSACIVYSWMQSRQLGQYPHPFFRMYLWLTEREFQCHLNHAIICHLTVKQTDRRLSCVVVMHVQTPTRCVISGMDGSICLPNTFATTMYLFAMDSVCCCSTTLKQLAAINPVICKAIVKGTRRPETSTGVWKSWRF